MEAPSSVYETIIAPFAAEAEGPFIYACYSHADRARVFPVLTRLYESGWPVWYDEGEYIEEHDRTVRRDRIEACAVFLLFLTGEALRSFSIRDRELPQAAEFNKPIVVCRLDSDIAWDAPSGAVFTKESGLGAVLADTAAGRADSTKRSKRQAQSCSVPVTCDVASKDMAFDFERCKDGTRLLGYKGCDRCVTLPPEYPEGSGLSVFEMEYTFFDKEMVEEVSLPPTLRRVGKAAFSAFLSSDKKVKVLLPDHTVAFSPDCVAGADFRRVLIFEGPGRAETEESEGHVLSGSSGFRYKVERGGITILKYSGSVDAVIEDSYEGYPVLAIGERAFRGRSDLRTVRLPDTLTKVGPGAFEDCSGLLELILPGQVRSVGERAFAGCSGLRRLVLSPALEELPPNMIKGCRSLKTLTVPDGVKTLRDHALAGAEGLNAVVLPAGLRFLGEAAFAGCDSLRAIALPEGLRKVDDHCFEGMTALREILIPEGVTKIGAYAFAGCTGLREVRLPESVRSVEESAFLNCSSLKKVIFPQRLYFIGSAAFEGCSGLHEIALPEGIREIPYHLFAGCKELSRLTLPEGVREVGTDAFLDCVSLVEIRLPDTVNKVPMWTFKGCTSLKNLTLSKAMKRIDSQTFEKLPSLERVVIGEGTQEIGQSAFRECGKLRSVTLPKSLKVLGEEAFSGCKSLKRMDFPGKVLKIKRSAMSSCESLEELILSDNTEEIGEGAFYGCSGLLRLVLPQGLTRIGEYAFQKCSGLKELVITGKPDRIGKDAFYECAALEKVELPDGMTVIPDRMFAGCVSLREIRIPDTVEGIGEGAFAGCVSLTGVRIPAGVTNFDSGVFAGCTGITEYAVAPGNLVLRAEDGVLFGDRMVLSYPCGRKGDYVIPEGVETIGRNAFALCPYLEGLVIPESVRGIDAKAFKDCTGLTSIRIPAGVEKIGYDVFAGCVNLQSIEVAEGNRNYCMDGAALLTYDSRKMLYYAPAASGNYYAIPRSVESVDGAFCDVNRPMEVLIKNGNVELSWNTFPKNGSVRIFCPPRTKARRFLEGRGFKCEDLQMYTGADGTGGGAEAVMDGFFGKLRDLFRKK